MLKADLDRIRRLVDGIESGDMEGVLQWQGVVTVTACYNYLLV
jgi:hypothetical protein